MNKSPAFEPLYPDVIGAIAGTMRITFGDTLQAAVGIFPRSAYVNQPIEVIVLLQSMTDQPTEVKVGLQLPKRAADGSPVAIATAKNVMSLTMSPGEVGVVRMPIVPVPPTKPSVDVPVRVAIRQRSRSGKPVRTPTRGAPPSVLAVSPFKLQVLRDVEWVDTPRNQSPENVTTSFDVAAKTLPPQRQPLKPTYEALWTKEQMRDERRNILSKMDEARSIAETFTRIKIYDSLLRAVDDTYSARGLPLHPGETRAIAKMLTYTLDDRSQLDPSFKIEDQRWFQVLCQALAHDESIAQLLPGEIVVQSLFDATMYEAVLLGFNLVRTRVRVNLGDTDERINYANRMMRWLSGQAEPDLVYIYLPLALGGVIVNAQVSGTDDNPWAVVDQMREAYRGRARLVEGDAMEIFTILDKLLTKAEDDLRRTRMQY